jgi:predicted acyl esterase
MLSYSSRPPDPLLAGDNRWCGLWLNRLQNQNILAPLWLRHQHRDAYWKRGSVW